MSINNTNMALNYQSDLSDIFSGKVPLRQLVYRVQRLPQSMLPLVSDFGTLSADDEVVYIKEIVKKHVGIIFP